jgi:HlyD family secretion protein
MRPAVNRARIRTARVVTGPVEAVIMASGTVAPEVERVLSSPLDARVLRLLQRPGAHLKRGDPVVELDVSESVLSLDKLVKDLKIKDNEQAQTRLTLERSLVDLDGRLEVKALELQSAQARFEDEAQLFKDGLVSREALRRTELAVKQANIELAQLREERKNAERATAVQLAGLSLERGSLDKEAAQARHLLDLSTTKSDRDGVLTWVVSQEGALVRRGDVIARIADLTSFRVDASVSDLHAGRLRTGMPAVVRVNDLDLEGTVTEVFPTVENGVLHFTVALAKPSHPGLRPSLRTDVLVITERKPRALRVKRGPFADNAARQAFVIRGDRAVRVPIEVGLSGVDDVELLNGAAEGDEIIISDMKDYMHLSEVRIR